MLISSSIKALSIWGGFVTWLLVDAIDLPDSSHINTPTVWSWDGAISPRSREYCFKPSFIPGLVPPRQEDCKHAALQILTHTSNRLGPIVFARKQTTFRLPWLFRNGSCAVSVDVPHDNDKDILMPWEAYTAAFELANSCVNEENTLGGKVTVGPRNLVVVMVFGRKGPSRGKDDDFQSLVLPASGTKGFVTRPAIEAPSGKSNDSRPKSRSKRRSDHASLENLPGCSNITTVIKGTPFGEAEDCPPSFAIPMLGLPTLSGTLDCFDPPLQRERSYPIDVSDCDRATSQIVGNRNRMDPYIFSRRVFKDPHYYRLPAKFRYGDCVVLLDMEDKNDTDRVRLAFVESSAYILAHKCSGEEEAQKKYGGSMLVGVGANDCIRIWVYNPRPPSSGKPVLSTSYNGSSIDYQ